MSLTERTTDDRLDDLLEAIEKQTALATSQRQQLFAAVDEIDTTINRIRRSVWWIALIVILNVVCDFLILLFTNR